MRYIQYFPNYKYNKFESDFSVSDQMDQEHVIYWIVLKN